MQRSDRSNGAAGGKAGQKRRRAESSSRKPSPGPKGGARGAKPAPSASSRSSAPAAAAVRNRAVKDFVIDHRVLDGALPRSERLASNSDYFDAIVSLVPPKYYLQDNDAAVDEDGMPIPTAASLRFYKKKGGTEGKQAIKSKRVRFDVGIAMTVPELQAAEAAGDGHGDVPMADAAAAAHAGTKRRRAEEESDAAAPRAPAGATVPVSRTFAAPRANIEDLRTRLHARIDELRRGRKTTRRFDMAALSDDEEGAPAPGDADAQPADRKRRRMQRPRKERDPDADVPMDIVDDAAPVAAATVSAAPREAGGAKRVDKRKERAPPAAAAARAPAPAPAPAQAPVAAATAESLDFAFGTIAKTAKEGGGSLSGIPGAAPAPQVKGSKKHRLQKMLEQAKRNQSRLQALTASGDTAARIASGMQTAMQRAAGVAVHDDPARINKSLKRMEKKKAKSSAEWAARTAKVDTERETVQASRTEARKNKKLRGLVSKEKAALHKAQATEGNGAAVSGKPASGTGAPHSGSKPRGPGAGFDGKKKQLTRAPSAAGGAKL